jgi:hypothetical protein
MKKGKCSDCGAEANVVRGAYHFEESALKNVILLGVETARCIECGNEDVSLPRVNKLMRALALGEGLQAHTADSVRRFERVTKPPRSTLRLQLDSETLEYQYA